MCMRFALMYMQIVSAGENGISKSVAGSIISGSTSCCSSSSSFSSLFLTPRTLRLAVLIILAAAVLVAEGEDCWEMTGDMLTVPCREDKWLKVYTACPFFRYCVRGRFLGP
uniref:Wsv268 n=1 Tax=White spot syndrome virus TaxID=92652 RepID=A0A2U9GBD4_WSSV|nr:wsv268 [Shrimp white spot syndrome virus]